MKPEAISPCSKHFLVIYNVFAHLNMAEGVAGAGCSSPPVLDRAHGYLPVKERGREWCQRSVGEPQAAVGQLLPARHRRKRFCSWPENPIKSLQQQRHCSQLQLWRQERHSSAQAQPQPRARKESGMKSSRQLCAGPLEESSANAPQEGLKAGQETELSLFLCVSGEWSLHTTTAPTQTGVLLE